MSPLETPGDANQLRYKALGTNLDDNYTDIHIRTYIFSTTHKGEKKRRRRRRRRRRYQHAMYSYFYGRYSIYSNDKLDILCKLKFHFETENNVRAHV